MSQLKDFIEIDKKFQNSINLQLDIDNRKKLNSYIPTRSSINILNGFLENVINNKEKANILIGPYEKANHIYCWFYWLFLKNQKIKQQKNF